MVSQGIKDGRACDALCEAVKESGKLLARHFPITHDDKDELSDEARVCVKNVRGVARSVFLRYNLIVNELTDKEERYDRQRRE
ncbi:MAG: hypothetical protein FJ240_00645, partial [Nitrospira sp.]|nr:hypothetical protein [Nitrospira sp.]